MNLFSKTLLALTFIATVAPAYGAWGDISYDTSPALVDEDVSASFDAFGFLSSAVLASGHLNRGGQNFESGFSAGQAVSDWVAIGNNRMRFGFGDSLNTVQWKGLIGGVDTAATAFGLTHPHGTYGNVAGVTDQPRNYVTDLNFITSATGSGAHYFVMQFDRPISFLTLSMLDYGTVGSKFSISLWNGDDLDSLVKVDQGKQELTNGNRTVPDSRPEGSFDYLVAKGDTLGTPFDESQTFNTAIVYLDELDPTVAFDNITIGMSSVPEPATLSLAGLGLIGMMASLRRRKALRA